MNNRSGMGVGGIRSVSFYTLFTCLEYLRLAREVKYYESLYDFFRA